MNRQNIIFASLLVMLAVALVAAGYATGRGPPEEETSAASEPKRKRWQMNNR